MYGRACAGVREDTGLPNAEPRNPGMVNFEIQGLLEDNSLELGMKAEILGSRQKEQYSGPISLR